MGVLIIVAIGLGIVGVVLIVSLSRGAPAGNHVEPLAARPVRRVAAAAASPAATRIAVVSADEALVTAIANALASYDVQLESFVVGRSVEPLVDMAPHLVVVHVEGGPINGFLVVKQIRNTRAHDAASMVIVSADANAHEIFEQHMKLRSRADAYVALSAGVGRGADEIAREIVGLVPLVAR